MFALSLVISGAYIVHHFIESAYHGEVFAIPIAIVASLLALGGLLELKRWAFPTPRRMQNLIPALTLLALPFSISAVGTMIYSLRLLQGDLTLPKCCGPQAFDATIIPAAMAGWAALVSLALLLWHRAASSNQNRAAAP